jgi:hypothetical protein
MNTSSAKAKGRRLQQWVVERILRAFPALSDKDVVSVPMGVNDTDVRLSECAQKAFNFAVECKNTERLDLWSSIKQCENDKREGVPLLVFKRNRSDVYCVLKFDDLINILKNTKFERIPKGK